MDKLILKEMLKRDEGLEQKAYLCPAGKITIGYGRNLEDRGLSLDECDMLLNNDIGLLEKELPNLPVYEELSILRRTVLANMLYNLGMDRLLKFKKMFKALEDKDYKKAAREMKNSKWYKDVGDRAKRLMYIMEYDKLEG